VGQVIPHPHAKGVDIMNIEFCKECADFKKCTHKEENCPYFEEEQAELQQKADKMPRKYEKSDKKSEKKPKTVKVSDEKVKIFQDIVEFLQKDYNICIEKDNKLIKIRENGREFKLDLIEKPTEKIVSKG
jgi:hypothetical protein